MVLVLAITYLAGKLCRGAGYFTCYYLLCHYLYH